MYNNWNPQQNYYYPQSRYQPAVPQVPQMQPMPQQPKPIAELPIVNLLFVTEQEANSYLPQPNTRVLLINRDKGEAYLKSADALGQTYLEPYVYKPKTTVPVAPTTEKKVIKKEKVEYITKKEFDEQISKVSKDLQELYNAINTSKESIDDE